VPLLFLDEPCLQPPRIRNIVYVWLGRVEGGALRPAPGTRGRGRHSRARSVHRGPATDWIRPFVSSSNWALI